MKNKLKQEKAGTPIKTRLPKGIKTFTEKPSERETQSNEAFDLFSKFTADIIRQEKLFVR
jgi:hypothetical protein